MILPHNLRRVSVLIQHFFGTGPAGIYLDNSTNGEAIWLDLGHSLQIDGDLPWTGSISAVTTVGACQINVLEISVP